MNSDINPPNSGTSIPQGRSKLIDAMHEEIGSSRPKRQRGKIDPTRVQGAWVISDASRIALEASELFEDLTREQRMEVAALVEEHTVEPGELLLNEGDPAQYIIIIAEGRGVAQIKTDNGWLSLGLVGPKDAAGWSSLLEGKTYPASVKALTPMRIARIEEKNLKLLMNLQPAIGYTIHRRLSTIFHRQYEEALKALKAF